ncbi:nucleotide exchange factor GrpE [Lentzea sp. NPDC042327]|uniref:nucleotide exchange factor GrpE n=1 Tax=Lentzea sp. NPDC042327 TaxID=3154801 RepID=UPI0033E6973B
MDTAPDTDRTTEPELKTDPEPTTAPELTTAPEHTTDHTADPPAGTDPAVERLDRIGALLEEVVDDNTAVTTSMNQLGQAQRALGADVRRELGELRRDLAAGLAYRTLKDLCVELIGPLGAMEAMLDKADFTDTEAVSGHVRSLVITLHGVLSRMGAERIAVSLGEEAFNPNRHRCVSLVAPDESPFPDAPPRTVVRVLEDGYLLDQRLLTPVAVEVQADRPAAGTEPETGTTTDTDTDTAEA